MAAPDVADRDLLEIAATRIANDDGARHSLEDVAAEFGINLDD